MRFTSLLAVCFAIAWGTAVRGDGIVYQLPENGGQARFDMEIDVTAAGQQMTLKGSLAIAALGETTVDGEKCRWIEMKSIMPIDGVERIAISKILVPEAHLAKGKSPGEKMIRGWFKEGDAAAVEFKDLKDPRAMMAAAFLSGPLQNSQDLAKAEIDNPKLGKLSCAGIAGSFEVSPNNDIPVAIQVENRLHEKAPFGLVSANWKFELKINGQTAVSGNMKLTLSDINTTALTELPDNN